MPNPHPKAPDLTDISVLYVEDDPVSVALVRAAIADRVGALHVAENGRDGLMAFVRFHPDVVVTDVRMPKMDGIAMATAMREMRPDTPIIVTTSLDDPALLRKAIRIGIGSYLLKPIKSHELLDVLGRLADTARHRLELDKQKRLNELLLDSLPNPAMLVDREHGLIQSANGFAHRLGLLPDASMADTPFAQLFSRAVHEARLGDFHSGTHVDFPGIGAYDRLWDVNIDLITDSLVLFFAVDITERHRIKEELQQEKAFIAAILENSHDGIAVVDAKGQVKFVSPGMHRLFGFTLPEMTPLPAWAGTVILDEAERALFLDLWQGTPGGEDDDHIFSILHKTGERRFCRLQTSRMPGGDIVINGQDITGIKLAEERIRHMALHDSLTGLPNRQLLQDRLQTALSSGKRRGTATAVLYIDLDRFKDINDAHGHDAGDEALRHTAGLLSRCLREADTVARMGGDEFVVVLPDLAQRQDAAEVASRILETLSRPLTIDGRSHVLGASIGIALHPQDGIFPDEILRKADRAMYETKKAGGMGFRFFTEKA
ncbi:two-component system response regulator [Desulfolutivibrio sp.]|uniref:two-component system response regulator n=1 Tax=Desulfolutivibrio sp. TaxID=2773296 RepID=UPI002F96C47B